MPTVVAFTSANTAVHICDMFALSTSSAVMPVIEQIQSKHLAEYPHVPQRADCRLALSAGTEATVQAAISKNGLEKLKRVVKSLTQNGHVHTLLFHWFGNYTLQDLVVASSKLRRSADHMLQHKPGLSEAQKTVLRDLIGGRNDLLGRLQPTRLSQ